MTWENLCEEDDITEIHNFNVHSMILLIVTSLHEQSVRFLLLMLSMSWNTSFDYDTININDQYMSDERGFGKK